MTSFSLTCLASSNFLLSKSKIILRWKSSHISKEDACWRTYPPDRLVYRMLWSVLWSSSTTCAFLQKKGFNGKYEMDVIDRYRRIKKILNNKTLSAMAYAVIFYAQNLKNFTIPLQSTQPMITVLHSKMVKVSLEKVYERWVNFKVNWTWHEFFPSDDFTFCLCVMSTDSKHLLLWKTFNRVKLAPLVSNRLCDWCIFLF